MSISSEDSVWSLGVTRIIVPIGATLAVFISPYAGQINCTLKYLSGGTCEILAAGTTALGTDVTLGTTQTPGVLATQSGFGYLLGASEVLSISGPASFYVSSTGATTILAAIFAKGQGK